MKKWDKEKPRGGALRGAVVGGPEFAGWHVSDVVRVDWGGGAEQRHAGAVMTSGQLEGFVEAGLMWLMISSCGVGNLDSKRWRLTSPFLSAQDVWRTHQFCEHL